MLAVASGKMYNDSMDNDERRIGMANINEFINTAKELADLAGKKAGEAVEVSKLKINHIRINGELQKAYEKLGAFVYKYQKSGEDNDELIAMCVKEIDDLMAALEENEQKINETRHKVKCTVCGAINDLQAVYCAKCGEKLPQETEEFYVEMDMNSNQTCDCCEQSDCEANSDQPSCNC